MKYRIVKYTDQEDGKVHFEIEEKRLFGWRPYEGSPFADAYNIYLDIEQAREKIKSLQPTKYTKEIVE